MVKGQWKKFTGKSAVWRHNNKDNKMEDINIGAITEALNDKSDRDLRNIDNIAGADAVIDYQEPTADNGYTWYRKYKSGWVEQGGVLSQTSGGILSVSFPVEMADTNYTLIRVQNQTLSIQSNYPGWTSGTESRTTTGFTYNGIATSVWQVSGKSAQ